MPRGRNRTFKIRLRTENGNKTVIIDAPDEKRAAARVKTKGTILSVRKVPLQELFGLNDERIRRLLIPDPKILLGRED